MRKVAGTTIELPAYMGAVATRIETKSNKLSLKQMDERSKFLNQFKQKLSEQAELNQRVKQLDDDNSKSAVKIEVMSLLERQGLVA